MKLPRTSRKKKTEQLDVGKLGKLVRLLSSDKDGEIIAAVGALRRALEAAGMDIHDLAVAAERGLQPAQQRQYGPPHPYPDDWLSQCWYCWHHRIRLHLHDREFIENMLLGASRQTAA